MISGIYRLKFTYANTDYYYVGKSIDIHRRLQEHMESFIKGKAAKKLQTFYTLAGEPELSILQRCHPDHIDVLEAYYIDFYKGPYSLNTVSMSNPFRYIMPEEFSTYLNMSTDSLIFELINEQNNVEQCRENIGILNKEIEQLERKRSDEEIQADIEHRIQDMQSNLDNKDLELNELKDKLKTYSELPWYKKIFTKPL